MSVTRLRSLWIAGPVALAAAALFPLPALHAAEPAPAAAAAKPPLVRTEAATRLMTWIEASDDNGTLPYIVIDKHAGALFLFDATGKFIGEAPVLIGIGVGDDSSPGVGSKKLASLGPAEKTTPAGRFIAKFGRAAGGKQVLWVDYGNSVALHVIVTSNRKERRLERLLSPQADDNRITFGCINIGATFYNKHLQPMFKKSGGVVYILPDTKPFDDVFPLVRLSPNLNQSAES